MQIDSTHRIGADHAAGNSASPAILDHEALLSTLREAARRAALQERPILASFTQAMEWDNSIHVFAGAVQAGLGDCFFWEQPAEQTALVGVGFEATIETQGSAYFTEAAAAWRALLKDAVVAGERPAAVAAHSGPLLFGGFSFDPLSPHTSLWIDFPDGLLILPQILVSYSANHVALTVNRMVKASDDVEQRAKEIEVKLRQLQAVVDAADIVEDSPSMQPEEMDGELISRDILPAPEWMDIVGRAVEMIQHGAFEKVVLARDIQVTLLDPTRVFDISTTLQRLRESYPGAYVFAVQRWGRFFVGATPERLVQASNGHIQTMALAGSARRGESGEVDAQLGAELLKSGKNNSEHAIVVAMVREALGKHCTNVHVTGAPELLKLKNVQHLMTPISGELLPGRCILDIMADLHPTPAVGGFPRQAALETIRNTEKLDRGWYAAPLGWIGMSGHGEFAVALRSGLIDGGEATLFAGCGIVADSDPQTEFAESCLKLQVMLRALGCWN